MTSRLVVGARVAYMVLAWLYVGAILAQVALIGLNLFAGEATRDAHIGFGHMIGLFPILLLILAFVGRLSRSAKWLAAGQFALFVVQAEVFAAIRATAPVVASYHPVTAMLVFSLAVLVAYRSLSLVRAPARAPTAAEPVVPKG